LVKDGGKKKELVLERRVRSYACGERVKGGGYPARIRNWCHRAAGASLACWARRRTLEGIVVVDGLADPLCNVVKGALEDIEVARELHHRTCLLRVALEQPAPSQPA